MISWLANQFRYLYGLLNTHDSPRQLALGCAFGVLLGLLPKGNLLALFAGLIFFSVRVNLSVGMLTALLLSFVAGFIDPMAHRFGRFLLSAPPLESLWTVLYNTPIIPWTRFNNTVVLGNFGFGLLLFYPVYRATVPLFEAWKKVQARRSQRQATAIEMASTPAIAAWRRQQFARLLAEVESLSGDRRAA